MPVYFPSRYGDRDVPQWRTPAAVAAGTPVKVGFPNDALIAEVGVRRAAHR